MAGNDGFKLNGQNFNLNNLPHEIKLDEILNKTTRDILSVFDTDNKKGVLSKNEIMNLFNYFARNDKFKEYNSNKEDINIGEKDAELIARKLDGGKFFGADVKAAFDYISRFLFDFQKQEDLNSRKKLIAPILYEIEKKGLVPLRYKISSEVVLDDLDNLGAKGSFILVDKEANIYVMNKDNKLEIVQGLDYKKDDGVILFKGDVITGKDGKSYNVYHNHNGLFVKVYESDTNVVTDEAKAAEILGLKAETRGGFLGLDMRKTGRYDFVDKSSSSGISVEPEQSWKIWNDKYKGFVTVKYEDMIISKGPISYVDPAFDPEEFLMNLTEIDIVDGKKVAKFKE